MYKIMENIFLINPEAGSRNRIQSIVDRIRKACFRRRSAAVFCIAETANRALIY